MAHPIEDEMERLLREQLAIHHGSLYSAVIASRRTIVARICQRLPLTTGRRMEVESLITKTLALWAEVWSPAMGRSSAVYQFPGKRRKNVLRCFYAQYELLREATRALPIVAIAEERAEYEMRLDRIIRVLDRETAFIMHWMQYEGIVMTGGAFARISRRCQFFLRLALGPAMYQEFDLQYGIALDALNQKLGHMGSTVHNISN